MAAALTSISAHAAFTRSARREIEFLRVNVWDRALVTWLPCLLLALLAWLFADGVPRQQPIAVVDHDRSAMSRELVRALDAAPGLHVAAQATTLEEAWALARRLEVIAVVHVPPNASATVLRGDAGTLFAYYNASYLMAGQAALREITAVGAAFNADLARGEIAQVRTPAVVRAAPVRVQTTVLFNAARSYEHFLLALVFPALLHLMLCIAVIGALGRELRDGTAGAWLSACGERLLPALIGKLAPYLLLFSGYAVAGLIWVVVVRGDGVAGSAVLLVSAYVSMLTAYVAIALLFIGATRNLATALSLAGLYAGTSLAFSGATFPLIGAPWFARLWSQLLPYSAYVKLQAQQLDAGAPWTASLAGLAVLLLFVLVTGAVGGWLYARALRDSATWGQR